MRLAQAMLEVFTAAGVEAGVRHLYELLLSPCRGCGRCRTADSGFPESLCPLSDAAPGLIREVSEANFLLLASPLHFTSLTAPAIAFFSRLQPFWQAKKWPAGPLSRLPRLAALALTAGSEYPGMFRPARSVAAAAFSTLAFPFAGMTAAAGTDRVAAADNLRALAAAARLARKMLQGLRSHFA